jgi:hypothetical protein
MAPISEFPAALDPPKKLDSTLLAEQDRQFASFRQRPSRIGRRSFASLNESIMSEEPEGEEGEEEDTGRITRRSSNRSLDSGDSPHRRLRGLKFTPCTSVPPSATTHHTQGFSDSAILDDDEEPFKPSHGLVVPPSSDRLTYACRQHQVLVRPGRRQRWTSLEGLLKTDNPCLRIRNIHGRTSRTVHHL